MALLETAYRLFLVQHQEIFFALVLVGAVIFTSAKAIQYF